MDQPMMCVKCELPVVFSLPPQPSKNYLGHINYVTGGGGQNNKQNWDKKLLGNKQLKQALIATHASCRRFIRE